MNIKEELKRIIDSLEDNQLPSVTEFLEWITPIEDEVLTESERQAIENGRRQIVNGEHITLRELLKELGDDG